MSVAAGLQPALPDLPLFKVFMAILSLAAAGVLLGLAGFLRETEPDRFLSTAEVPYRYLPAYHFDQFGLVDLVFLVVNILPILLLFKDRAWYLQGSPRPVGIQ